MSNSSDTSIDVPNSSQENIEATTSDLGLNTPPSCFERVQNFLERQTLMPVWGVPFSLGLTVLSAGQAVGGLAQLVIGGLRALFSKKYRATDWSKKGHHNLMEGTVGAVLYLLNAATLSIFPAIFQSCLL